MSAFLHATPRGNPQQILATVWERNLPVVRQRISALRTAADQSHAGPLSTPVRVEAAGIAHKLAGSLGMFGYAQGSVIARQIETLLDCDDLLSAEAFEALTVQLEKSLAL